MSEVPKQLKKYAFKKGQTGNAGGRPKGASITSAIRRFLASKVPNDEKDRTYTDLFAESMIKHAIQGHGAAMSYVLDRTEGKVKERIDHEITNKISVDVIKEIREAADLEVPKEWTTSNEQH